MADPDKINDNPSNGKDIIMAFINDTTATLETNWSDPHRVLYTITVTTTTSINSGRALFLLERRTREDLVFSVPTYFAYPM